MTTHRHHPITSALVFAAIWTLLASCTAENHDRNSIRRGNGGEPGSLDPALAQDVHAFNVLTDMYEGLVALAADASVVPGVASSWTISEDGRRYTFVLRDDARWSNGQPVLAGDFVASLRRIADPETHSAYGALLGNIEHFAGVLSGELAAEELGVTATGERQLEIRLHTPTPYFLSLLAMPIAFPVYGLDRGSGVAPATGAVVSNGPFALHTRVVGGEIRLRRNPHYWDAAAIQPDEIVFVPIVDADAELAMFLSGELDVTNTVPPGRLNMPELRNLVRSGPSLALYYLAFDIGEPPLDDVFLRRALTMAIDRQQLADLMGRGEQPAYSIVPPGTAGYAGPGFEWRSLSAGERASLAREAYVRAGYGPDTPLQIEYLYDTGDVHEKVALIVSSMWRDVLGVEVTLRKMEWKYFLQTRGNRSQWQIMRFAWVGDFDDASTFTDIFRGDDPQNLSGFDNERYDALLSRAASTLQAKTRASLLADAESLLLAEYPVAPLYFIASKHVVRAGLSGFEHNVLDRHPSKYLRWESVAGPGRP